MWQGQWQGDDVHGMMFMVQGTEFRFNVETRLQLATRHYPRYRGSHRQRGQQEAPTLITMPDSRQHNYCQRADQSNLRCLCLANTADK